MAKDNIGQISARRSSRIVLWLAACSAAAWLIGQKLEWSQGGPVHPGPGFHPVKTVAPAWLPATNQTQASGSDPVSFGSPIFIPPPPPSPEPISKPQDVMKLGQFRLTGTAIFGNHKRALLLETASGAAQVVAEGEMINGMLVEQIDAERITLSMAGGQERIGITAGPAITAACSETGVPCFDAAASEPVPAATTSNEIDPRTAEFRAARAQRRLARAAAQATR